MDLNILKEKYQELLKMEDTDDGIFKFKEMLLESDASEVLDFHLKILETTEDEYLKRDFFSFFSKRKSKEKVAEYLFEKFKNAKENENALKADIIQILGHLRSKYGKKLALENITIRKGDIRYRCIIVLGWLGDEHDLEKLNERLLNDPDGQLRCYAATAMRQIWYNHPKTKDKILGYLKEALDSEADEKALEGIIITAQDLLKKKLGVKESEYGDLEGDIILAKARTQTALEKF